MFHPNRWIQPRLKSYCVAFGLADVILVLLSIIGWSFFFNISFQAQQHHLLLEYRSVKEKAEMLSDSTIKIKLFPKKEKMKEEELRRMRTIRACGLAYDAVKNELHHNSASPGAMIGASMGGYFVLGTLLSSLHVLKSPTGRKVVCRISLIGEVLSTLLLFIAVSMLLASGGLCTTEYYFESFQPVLQTFTFTLIAIFTYKAYEVTVILLFFLENSELARKEVRRVSNELRISIEDNPHKRRRHSHKKNLEGEYAEKSPEIA